MHRGITSVSDMAIAPPIARQLVLVESVRLPFMVSSLTVAEQAIASTWKALNTTADMHPLPTQHFRRAGIKQHEQDGGHHGAGQMSHSDELHAQEYTVSPLRRLPIHCVSSIAIATESCRQSCLMQARLAERSGICVLLLIISHAGQEHHVHLP